MEFKGVTFRCEEEIDHDLWSRLPEDLQNFYQSTNGLVAFNGGLQVRSCTTGDTWHALGAYWKGDQALYKTYPNLLESDIPFAQDCMGDQFFLRDDMVWLLGAETGDVVDMEVDLEEFFESSIEDPIDYLAMEPLAEILDRDGELEVGNLVHIVPGLSLDSPVDTVFHLDTLPVVDRLDWLKSFFRENHA